MNKKYLEEAKKSGDCSIVFDFEIDEYKDIRVKSFDNEFQCLGFQTESASKVISEILQQQYARQIKRWVQKHSLDDNET